MKNDSTELHLGKLEHSEIYRIDYFEYMIEQMDLCYEDKQKLFGVLYKFYPHYNVSEFKG